MNAFSGKRILVVEDEALVACLVEEMLTELGAIVIGPATSVTDGLRMAEKELIDMAVLDVNVRDERIDPVARVLQAKNVPVVFATGYGTTMVSSTAGGVVLEKPYTHERLVAALIAALGLTCSSTAA
jgi:DNA-binding response OmpR family regulator